MLLPGLERVAGSGDLQGSFEAFKFSETSLVRFQVANVDIYLFITIYSLSAAPGECPVLRGRVQAGQLRRRRGQLRAAAAGDPETVPRS